MSPAPSAARRGACALAAILVLAACERPAPIPGYFSRAELLALTDDDDGAETRAQLIYHYLKKDRAPGLKTPAWIDRALPAMLKHGVYQDPDDGLLNEAQLWQAPVAVLYEFFELTRATYPASYGGRLAKATDLAAQYRDNATKLALATQRLRDARLEGSLDGRGREALDALDKIVVAADGLAGSLAAPDESRFKPSVLAIAADTRELYRIFQDRPR